VFAGEATEIDLLRHGSRFCSALEAVFMKTSTERPVFFSMACVVAWLRCRFNFASQVSRGR
jgi:hypothetical protein